MATTRNAYGALGRRDLLVWVLAAVAAIVAPWIFSTGLAVTMLSQMAVAIVACLSFNILLGQGGMLSFGHAVYTGLGAFVAIHALSAVNGGTLVCPVSLIPLIGGLAGLGFAALLGYVTTKKSGTAFAMITLGLGELVGAMALMVPEFFGGEAGVTANRVTGQPFMGLTFGPQIQVYYLLAVYAIVCTALMYAFTRTPLGRMLNAVRDNPERVEFIGYNPQRVRYMSFMVAGLFAGIAGGMAALNFEIATAEVVGAARSGSYLLFTFLGGATYFFGPIIGAVLMIIAFVMLSELTKAWLLYLGLVFMLMVMVAPGGIASLVMMNVRLARHGRLRGLLWPYLCLALATVPAFLAVAALIEMVYHLQLNAEAGTVLRFAHVPLDVAAPMHWVGVAVFAGLALALFEWVRRRFSRAWDTAQEQIEAAIQARMEAESPAASPLKGAA